MPYFHPVTPDEPLIKKIRHTRTDQFLWEDQAQDEDGDPYDYTGHTFSLEIKEHKDADVAVVTIPDDSFTLDASAEGAAAGVQDKFLIDHPPADFADLIAAPFEYYFDIQILDALSKPFTPIKGIFQIIGD